MTTDPLDLLRANLDRVKDKPGVGFMARCPAHDDQHASLSVDRGDDGRALLKCFAGCEVDAIVAALSLRKADLFPPRESALPSPPERRVVATYDYTDETGARRFQVMRYEPKSFVQRRPDGTGGWTYNLAGVEQVLYRLSDLLRAKPDEVVIVCEGEKDVDRLRRDGFVATTHAGGTGNTTKMLPLYVETLAGRHVVIIPDNDDPGRVSADTIARALHDHAASVKMLCLVGLPAKGDVSDWLTSHTADEFRAKIEVTKLWQPTTATDATEPVPPAPSPQSTLKVIRLDTVQEREIDWLWDKWIARRELSIHAAHPGLGKTTFSLALTAAFTTGGLLPDGARAPVTDVLLMLAEDSLETTVVKGLRLHGADMSRVHFSQVVVDQDGTERSINLAKHLPEIERVVTEHDIGLVILDPLTGFSQGKDRNSEGDVRDTLTPLRQLAERHEFAVLGIAHFGKANGTQRTLLQSVLGSTGYVALARTVLASAELAEEQQPSDADLETGLVRITQVVKSNLDVRPPAVTWRRPRDGAIQWLGPSDLNVDDVLNAPRDRGASSVDQAKAFIEDELHGGSRSARHMEAVAKQQGISKTTLKRAKRDLGVESLKVPHQDGEWLWKLPSVAPGSPPRIEGDQAIVEGDQLSQTQTLVPFDLEVDGGEGDQEDHVNPLAYVRQKWAPHTNGRAGSASDQDSKGTNVLYTDPLVPFDGIEPEPETETLVIKVFG